MSIKEAESIVRRLLQEEGVFKQKNMVVVLTGLMEAGKTTLLHRLFGKDIPEEYSSTGVAERSWRGITQYIVNKTQLKLLENPQDMIELLAQVKKATSNKTTEKRIIEDKGKDMAKEEYSITSAADDTGSPIRVEIGHRALTDQSHRAREGNSQAMSQPEIGSGELKKSYSFREYVDIVRTNPNEYYGELELVHVIDTGGQPECLMVMPSLIQNADLVLLVVNLLCPLDTCTTPTFHKDGKKFKKEPLITCNKDMIQQLAHTMVGRSNSKIIIVATHKDKISDQDLTKALTDLNRFIVKFLPPESLIAKSKRQVVFDIDLLHPNETLEMIRENIINVKVKSIEIPSSFVLFENDVLQYVNKKKKEGRKVEVLKSKECVQIGKNLHMTEKIIEAALTYLHKNNILLFFKEIGPGLVFFDPNILISFIDTIVRFSYMVTEEEHICPSLTVSQIDSLSKGIFTEDILKHEFMAKNFVPGLFEAGHAIEIFKLYHVIAELNFKHISPEEACLPKYIMMCLLPHLSQEDLDKKLVSISPERNKMPEPLIIQFGSKGSPPNWKLCCSPSGCFGGTIACLMSDFHWKICTDSKDTEYECLFHEVATLKPHQIKVKLTLVNKTSHFEVYVKTRYKPQLKKLPSVRTELVGAVQTVLKTMKMNLTVAKGLKCTCKEKCVFHVKYLLADPETSEEYVECEHAPRDTPISLWASGTFSFCIIM